ncbi:MAG TPA: DUF192 domain-containing protein [Gammaproteobacteria bacterium]|nr:DUF192 domain-containing protein [Gammaproteobacteria bacterium]
MNDTDKYSFAATGLLAFTVTLALATAQAATLRTEQIELGHHRFKAEIAATDAAREHGLMNRTHMTASHGMLFVYADAQPRYFWMKDTLIPLDILFFDAQRHLINVSADTPPCKADPCPTFASAAPAKYVLELNAGTVKSLGIKTGDAFKLD